MTHKAVPLLLFGREPKPPPTVAISLNYSDLAPEIMGKEGCPQSHTTHDILYEDNPSLIDREYLALYRLRSLGIVLVLLVLFHVVRNKPHRLSDLNHR